MKPKLILLNILILFITSCAPYLKQPITTSEARLGANTKVHDEMELLPEPKEKIVVSVYKFRDQTGQYKPTEVGSSWSTAVTQGATSILLKSLEESDWFIPIEREGLANLLNERKIIRSSRANYLAGKEKTNNNLLPPLLFAGVILEGGIVSYESNVLTGGAGARYFGAGGSAQYREDRITIYLRAVSTSNGHILKTVYTSKTILSQKVDFGVFRFVSLKRLLEVETGFTFNEPSEVAVKEAIDKAVYSLIVEGILDGIWYLKDENDKDSIAIKNYLEEKEFNEKTDFLGYVMAARRSDFLLGISGGIGMVENDYPKPLVRPKVEIRAGFFKSHALSFDVNLGYRNLANSGFYNSDYFNYDIDIQYRFFNYYKYSPRIEFGVGAMVATEYVNKYFFKYSNPYVLFGLGYEHLINDKIGLDFHIRNQIILHDKIDEIIQGKYNDYFWSVGIGINFYL